MKKIILFFAIYLTASSVFAQGEKYNNAMKANLAAIDTSFRNPANLIVLANSFERIAAAEKNQWLPYYYAAFLHVNYGFVNADKSKTDMIADKAAALISTADSLSPNNSEISCVKSMIASCRLMVDPMKRYMQYGPESSLNLEKAILEDPSNPRPYLLKGQGLKYTPEQFGGGCKTAMEQLETATAKFATFKPASELHPDWGKTLAEKILAECMK
jgi:hypothetical protein